MSRYIIVVYELLFQRLKSDIPLKPLGYLADEEFDQLMAGPVEFWDHGIR